MKTFFFRIISISLLILPLSCSLFEFHPYEVRLDEHERDLNKKAIGRIQSTLPSDTIRFILIGDTQRFYDETEAFVASANLQPIDFVVLAGDISDFGLDKEFQWINKILSGLDKPYVAAIGNHDLSGEGEAIFQRMYGPLNDSFIYGDIKFVLINTNSREYVFNGRVPDLAWLRQEMATDDFHEAVVIGHVPPFDHDFDPTLEMEYAAILRNSGKVNFSLYAHQHTHRDTVWYNDGIRYIIAASMEDRFYLLVEMAGGTFTVKKIRY
jgi:3',5'-cyclic-AMP phosphodiesterase